MIQIKRMKKLMIQIKRIKKLRIQMKNIDLNQLSPNVLENYENYHLYIFIYFI